ncbi:cyanophycin synthetase [Aquabacterium sp. NJ1]|uniref:cyanophycin synthetase n=1 Tax=Aquabacterium sp. NJ1 TaxID=1538295 RepID=UPI00052DB5F2|nr:cyanophycin synthetase [Aquabacterium sp. NJ1]KGM39592.1 cyanophycin synthetase [Aquabacterium sp. NJ1]
MSKKNDIKLLRINYLRGPNIWTYRPVLEVWLDLGELEDHPSHMLPGFNERLTTMLPALVEHHCGVGERGGFIERLTEGTWAGHILEHVVIELLNLAGMPTGFGQTRSTSQHGVYRMVFRARDEQVARTALKEGHALLMAAINDEPFDVDKAVEEVRTHIDDYYLGPSTAAIVGAATDRRIPHIRLNDGNLVQLGYGAAQRRIWTAETDLTSAIAEGISRDKDLTKSLLKSCGVPVPEGQIVNSADEAWDAAEDIGLPVVVKPTDGNHGRGVSLDLRSRADVEAAFKLAEQHGSEVLVERYIRGDEHRILVVGGKVVAAARGESAWVTGDGQSTVVELIDQQLNTDPRRGLTEDFPLNRINIEEDEVVQLDLQRQGLSPQAVPADGRRVLIQRNGNVAIDCTDEVHPDVAYLVGLAARVVGLDIAGVDVVAEDISKPLLAQGGAVVEVNAGPGLLMHLKPAEGLPRPVGKAIVDHLFDEEATGRVPIIGVAGSQGTNNIARLTAWLLHLSGKHVGLACRDGLFLGSRRVESGDRANWDAGQRLLMNREVNAIVLENGAASILNDGLAYDRCAVGVVTDLLGSEAPVDASLAEHDIHEPSQLFKVLRTQVDVVLPDGVAVLNAADERLVEMAELCDGEVIFYDLDHLNPAMVAHRAKGGRTVSIEGHHVLLTHNGYMPVRCADLNSAAARRMTGIGASEAVPGASVKSLLAAVAVAWALGIPPELIAAGLETFDPAPKSVR